VLDLDALDGEEPSRLSVVAPPEELSPLPSEELAFEISALDSFSSWACSSPPTSDASGLAGAQTRLPAGVSPWDVLPRVLTSIDYLKKEAVRKRALRKRWDLIIVDEAHALAESGTPQNPYRTQRRRRSNS
jgi:hypothetical protein